MTNVRDLADAKILLRRQADPVEVAPLQGVAST